MQNLSRSSDALLQVDFEAICVETAREATHRMQALPGYAVSDSARPSLSDWAAKVLDVERTAIDVVDAALDDAPYLDIIRTAFDAAFQSGEHLARFETLRQHLHDRQLPAKVQTIIATARSHIYPIRDAAVRELCRAAAGSSKGDVFAPLRSSVSSYLIISIVQVLKLEPLPAPPPPFRLIEVSDIEVQRAALQRKKDSLFNASVTFTNFAELPPAASPAPPETPTSPAGVSGPSPAMLDNILDIQSPSSSPRRAGHRERAAFSAQLLQHDDSTDTDDATIVDASSVPAHSEVA